MHLRQLSYAPHALLTLSLLCAAAGSGQGQGFFSRREGSYEEEEGYEAPQRVRSPQLPAAVDFAGEGVPLENFDTRESLERELTVNMFWHSQTLHIIKLANRFFPTIEAILKMNNLPDDFKYLCAAESGLQQVVSPMRAVGFWQILPATGKELGLEISGEVDERYHIEKSTLAACKFLQKSYNMFGSWSMAAASYNMGSSGLRQQVVRQKSASYHDMTLSEETSRYLFRILALKLIIANPQRYGFNVQPDELYPPYRYREVKVTTAIPSWADFAAQYGTNYKVLKILNPWLRDAALHNKAGKTYYIKVPEAGFRENAYK
jgi:hypothetical protein